MVRILKKQQEKDLLGEGGEEGRAGLSLCSHWTGVATYKNRTLKS